MLDFSGLTQVKSIEPSNNGGLILTCIHCRKRSKLRYDGRESFDSFQITVFNNKKSPLIDSIHEGDILFITNGRLFSSTKIISNKRYWFTRLGVDIMDITVLGNGEVPPEYDDHLDITAQDNGKSI